MTRRAEGSLRTVDRVERVQHVDLRLVSGDWHFATRNAARIVDNWRKARQENPSLFNGVVHVLGSWSVSGGKLSGSFTQTDFASFLFWRTNGYPAADGTDCFGSAIVRTADGLIVLGVAAKESINAGFAYPPGGFIDEKDVTAEGRIDIDGSIEREAREEIGWGADDLQRVPGYWLTRDAAQLSIGIEFRARQSAQELCERIRADVLSQPNSELADVIAVRPGADLPPDVSMPSYARRLLQALPSE
jgi:hypothetical protein